MVLMTKESNVGENISSNHWVDSITCISTRRWNRNTRGNCRSSTALWRLAKLLSRKFFKYLPQSSKLYLFFLKYNVITGNEWFGDFQIESRHLVNDSFSRFELRVLYDNMNEQLIGRLPKTILNSYEFQKSKDTINFSIDKRYKNLAVGVSGPNFCGTLKPIRFYYYQCPSSTRVLVNFKATHAPSKNSSPILLKGNCAHNAVQSNSYSLSMKCYYNGSYEVFGSCLCNAGFSNLANGRNNNNCKG